MIVYGVDYVYEGTDPSMIFATLAEAQDALYSDNQRIFSLDLTTREIVWFD